MVGHLLEYHPGVRKLKELTDSGELGDEIYYIYGNRLNLGKLRADENALWSLGAHDVSVVLYLAGEEPSEVVAHGESYVRAGVEDVVFCFLRFPSGLAAHLHLSLAGSAQGTPVHRRRLAADGDLRRHGARAQADRSTTRALTRTPAPTANTSPAAATSFSPADPQRRAPAHRMRALRRRASARGRRRARTAPAACGSVRVLEALQRSLDAPGAVAAPDRGVARADGGLDLAAGARLARRRRRSVRERSSTTGVRHRRRARSIGAGAVHPRRQPARRALRGRGRRGARQAASAAPRLGAAGATRTIWWSADDVTICCGAVVYAGRAVGAGAIVGDQSQLRERAVIGERTVLGRGSHARLRHSGRRAGSRSRPSSI